MKNIFLTGLIFAVLLTISFSLFFEPVFAQNMMSPRHQMQMTQDPSQIQCRDGMVLMMRTNGNPACISPSSYWRLADRGWGTFDPELLAQNQQQMKGVVGSMMNHPQMAQYMHDWMSNNPEHMQTMMDYWMPKMTQNNQWMMNMMGPMMNDPELRNQMMTHMMNHPQMMQDMKTNQQWTGMMMGQPMMDGMYHGMMMNNATMNCPWCPFMQDHQTNQGMDCPWCSSNMGHGMMMKQKGMKSSMMGEQTRGHGWTLHNPQHMHGMMNHMMADPEMMTTMHAMMMKNPQHMHSMMNHMIEPMMTHMMADPEMRQQMMTHMMNHPQMMQQWMQNQQFLDNLTDDDSGMDDKDESKINSQNTQVSIALGSVSPGCETTNECYIPYSVSIKEHSSVTWTNDDMAVHTATSGTPSNGPDGIFDSGLISPGATFTNQFNEEGTFDYYCIAHPWMTGKVIVMD